MNRPEIEVVSTLSPRMVVLRGCLVMEGDRWRFERESGEDAFPIRASDVSQGCVDLVADAIAAEVARLFPPRRYGRRSTHPDDSWVAQFNAEQAGP